MFAFGWIAFVAHKVIIAVNRHFQRRLYGIPGSGTAHVFAILFIWPQVVEQMTHQTEFVRVEQKPGG